MSAPKPSTIRRTAGEAPAYRVRVRVGDREWVAGEEAPMDGTLHSVAGSKPSVNAWHPAPSLHQVKEQPSEAPRRSPSIPRWSRWLLPLLRRCDARIAAACEVLRPLIHPAAVRTTTGFRPRGQVRRLRDSFQTGLILGLALGILSLLWFHQLEPWRDGDNLNQAVTPSVATAPQGELEVPGFSVQALTVQRFPSVASVPSSIRRRNDLSIWTLPSGQVLAVQQVAITSSPLKSHASGGATVVPVNLPVTRVPIQTGTASHADAVSGWLYQEAAALRVLTAVVMQGTSAQDAEQAHANAAKARPADTVLASTGYADKLNAFANAVEKVYGDWQQGRTSAARTDLAKAYQAWLQLAANGA
ncbi:MAG: hypothetical protein IRZ10_06055 [Thermoflavifilum sp.]|nr:hypothetical protein [Thermoflavifilum sp.]